MLHYALNPEGHIAKTGDQSISAACDTLPSDGARAAGRLVAFAILLSVTALCGGVAVAAVPTLGAPRTQVFGPGKVECQKLDGTHFDCLLTTPRITRHGRNTASFDIAVLPAREQAIFRRWCIATADNCMVTVRGTRETPEATRLSTVASIGWTRPNKPRSQAAARAVAE